jgi:hypothetical protein
MLCLLNFQFVYHLTKLLGQEICDGVKLSNRDATGRFEKAKGQGSGENF